MAMPVEMSDPDFDLKKSCSLPRLLSFTNFFEGWLHQMQLFFLEQSLLKTIERLKENSPYSRN